MFKSTSTFFVCLFLGFFFWVYTGQRFTIVFLDSENCTDENVGFLERKSFPMEEHKLDLADVNCNISG